MTKRAPAGSASGTVPPSASGRVKSRTLRRARDHGGSLHPWRPSQRAEIFDLVGRIPLTAHGVGLSIGTDVPLDLAYLDQVAAVVDASGAGLQRAPRLHARSRPRPRQPVAAAEDRGGCRAIIAKVRTVQSRIPVPFLLENISYAFEWPDSDLSDAEFLNLICRETGAGILLDIENLYLNSRNHGFDPHGSSMVCLQGSCGRCTWRAASSCRRRLCDAVPCRFAFPPVPDETLDLLDYALARHTPATVVLERDDRLDAGDEILGDIARIRACVEAQSKKPMPKRLLDRQVSLLEYLTNGGAIFGETADAALDQGLQGIDRGCSHIEARFSHEKRMEKIAAVFPRTFELSVPSGILTCGSLSKRVRRQTSAASRMRANSTISSVRGRGGTAPSLSARRRGLRARLAQVRITADGSLRSIGSSSGQRVVRGFAARPASSCCAAPTMYERFSSTAQAPFRSSATPARRRDLPVMPMTRRYSSSFRWPSICWRPSTIGRTPPHSATPEAIELLADLATAGLMQVRH